MSSNYENTSPKDEAAEAVRQAFAALPLEKKVSTLVRVELDMLGEIADSVASAASSAFDEMARAFNNARREPSAEPKPGGSTV